MVFNVSYDLRKPGKDYTDLIAEIKRSDGWAHPLESTWLISTSETADQLYVRLRQRMDANDYILVMRVTQPSNGWLPQDQWNWISTHVFS